MKKLVFLLVLIAFASPVAIFAEEVDNSHLIAENNLMPTEDSYVAQDGCALKEECPLLKPKEECNKCPPRKQRCDKCPPPQPKDECNKCPPRKQRCDKCPLPKPRCDKCPPRKPRCNKCPPPKPKCEPKEEPKKSGMTQNGPAQLP